MKASLVLLGLAALALVAAGAGRKPGTPVSRVVSLLQNLKKELEAERKAEKDVMESFNCWCKTVLDSKEASMTAADSRIDSLKAYVADIEAGKMEFTSERADLELQEKELMRSMEKAKALREEEEKDFLAAKDEMEKAIAALDEAIKVLKEGQPAAAAFAQMPRPQLLGLRWELRRALELGRSMMDAGDARAFERLLSGDPNDPDWKKLNRKATFKKKYTSETGKILELLEKMLKTFKENLAEAEAKEAKSKEDYEKLMNGKKEMLEKTQQGLIDMVKEGAARGQSLEEAKAEIVELEEQKKADKKFAEDTKETCAAKDKEFQERMKIRSEELAAISKAISILHSDDARDKFKTAYSFLQVSSKSAVQQRVSAAIVAIGAAVHDPRVELIARLAYEPSWKDKVIPEIDKLIEVLQKEAETDLTRKEACEKELGDLTREAKVKSVAIDDLSEEIEKAEQKAKEIQLQIDEEKEQMAKTKEDIKSLEENREKEKKAFEKAKFDDEEAIALLKEAEKVLTEYYAGMKAALVARHTLLRHGRMDPVAAGEAPPPPPATWEKPYEGSKGGKDNIITMLQMLVSELEGDVAAAEAAEKKAKEAYAAQLKELEESVASSEKLLGEYKGQKADAEGEVADKTAERKSEKEVLDSTMKEIETLRPGCDWAATSFKTRVEARNVEIDGLKKAKAILLGAEFD